MSCVLSCGVLAVMVSAGFVHLLGQAIVELPVRDDTVFPWAPFLCGVGFLSTLLADQYAESLSEKASGSATPGFAQMRSCHSRDNSFLGSGPSLILDHEGAFLQQVAVAGAWNATGEDCQPHATGRVSCCLSSRAMEVYLSLIFLHLKCPARSCSGTTAMHTCVLHWTAASSLKGDAAIARMFKVCSGCIPMHLHGSHIHVSHPWYLHHPLCTPQGAVSSPACM